MRDTHYTPGIVRIPKESKARLRQTGLMKKVKNKAMNFLFSSEGILTNLMVVIVHLFLLLVVPLVFLTAVIWCLIQISNINQSIYEVNVTFFDVFNPSSYEFWFTDLDGKLAFFIIAGLSLFFIFSGLVELLSFYATGPRDTGKYIVKKSWLKWFFTISFWVILVVFLSLYTAYFSVILVWCVLGAVLNPQKFLPMAVGAVVVIGFSVLLYVTLKKINKSLQGMVGNTVDSELKSSLVQTVKKEISKITHLRNPPVEDHTRIQFHRALNSYMEKNDYPLVAKKTTDSVLDGDMGALINKIMNKNCGIDKNIGLGLVGWLKQDEIIIMDSIHKLADELGQDTNLNDVLAEIALDKYNPDSVGINRAQGTIILSLKKLFRKAFPQFPLETLSGLLQVVSEGDPRPLKPILDKLNIPSPLFNMSIGFVTDDKEMIQKSVLDVTKDILPPHFKNFFDSLYSIFKGNPKAGLGEITQNLNIPYEFLIQFIVAVSKQDNSLVRFVLSTSVDQIFVEFQKQGLSVAKENVKDLKSYLLAIYTLSKGSEFDIVKLVKENLPKVDPYAANVFYKASKGDIKKFDKILDSMGVVNQKKAVLEFCQLLFDKDIDIPEISGRLGVTEESSEILHAALRLMIVTSHYFIKIMPKFSNMAEQMKEGNQGYIENQSSTQMSESILAISSSIKKYLHILYNSNIIEPDLTGFTGKVVKIGSFIKEMFYQFSGEEEFRETPRYKKLDITVRREQLMASSNMAMQRILKGDHTVVENIIDQVMDYLEFKTEKRNYFTSICMLVTSFKVDMPVNEDEDNIDLQTSFKMVSQLLELDENNLRFILDVFSGNPYRIFQCNTVNPKINFETLELSCEFLPSRIAIIMSVLE